MDNALGVGVMHGLGHERYQSDSSVDRHQVLSQHGLERMAVDVLHREIMANRALPDAVNLHNVGVVKAGSRPRLGLEPSQANRIELIFGQQQLDGNQPV